MSSVHPFHEIFVCEWIHVQTHALRKQTNVIKHITHHASCNLFTADNAPIFANLSISSTDLSSSPSPTDQVIPSVENLILKLPTITDPVGFGLRLGVGYNRCEQLIKDHSSNINDQVRSIAAEWYNLTLNPTWNKVVEALHNHGRVTDAVQLASKTGVPWKW